MTKSISSYAAATFILIAVYSITFLYPQEKNFRTRLLDYINEHGTAKSGLIDSRAKETSETFNYNPGDWEKFIIQPQYRNLYRAGRAPVISGRSGNVNVYSYGSMNLDLVYGKSRFTRDRYRQYDRDRPASRVIQPGFTPQQELLLHMEGTVGNRLTLFIDHDSRKKDNRYMMQYRAEQDDEIIREINAGEIDIDFRGTKYAVYDNTSAKGLGMDITLKKGNLQVKAFGSVSRGETEVETFRGNSAPGSAALSEYQYVKRTYYQLEPFKRYDGLDAPPVPGDDPYNTLNTFQSNDPSFTPSAVNIDPEGFEIYMDDQNPYNNYNAEELIINNGAKDVNHGFFTKLSQGTDYSINFSTGLITFISSVPAGAKICAVYTRLNGSVSTSDPSARTGTARFPGKIFVFIKYGYSMEEDVRDPGTLIGNFILDPGEDRNSDGVMNLDIYEVRSFYFTGTRQLLQDNISIRFLSSSRDMTTAEKNTLGAFSLDYSGGIIGFNLREPFRQLLSPGSGLQVYSENQDVNAYEYSLNRIAVDYYSEARSFHLKHYNILPGSVRIKVNSREIPESLYIIDHTSGFLEFVDSNNPLIGPETVIEVKYEYLPFAGQGQSFIGGVRTDYKVNRNLKVGGTFLYSRSPSSEIIPDTQDAPTRTVVIEGDTELSLGGGTLARLVNVFTEEKYGSVPVEINAYAEVAKSIKNMNTFGKGLIDNMESDDIIVSISTSERDWILSSLPLSSALTPAARNALRGLLFYRYYRDPSDPYTLKGESFSAASVDYSVRPGPYNIATGHISESIEDKKNQRSLVFDFEIDGTSGREYVSAVTQKLSEDAVDFSGLQYIEISYRYDGAAPVDLFLDLGRVNEDSDEDGVLDTEDSNSNGFLDYDPDLDFSEDRGFLFNGNDITYVGPGPGLNSLTRGDGTLNTEDLNGNGTLDFTEQEYVYEAVPAGITLAAGDPDWKTERIYIDTLSPAESDLLSQVESLRLYIKNSSGSTVSGRLFIDSIKCVSSRWRNPKKGNNPADPMDEVAAGPDVISVTVVDSINDSDYRADAFLFSEKNVYTSLYGKRDESELEKERESALQIEYTVESTSVSVTRNFATPIDIQHYRTLNLWMNYRNFSAGDMIGVIVGSSENDYLEYRFPMEYTGLWKEIRCRLLDGSTGGVSVNATEGSPDLKRISFIKILVYGASPGSTGKLWLNDIYVSEPRSMEDTAHWYEGEINITRPLFRTSSGMPVLSDLNVKYIRKGHGSGFSTVGKTVEDMSEKYTELYSSVTVVPGWTTSLDFINEDSETDRFNSDVAENKRGKTSSRSLYFVSDYVSRLYGIPSIKLAYKYNNYRNTSGETVYDYSVNRMTDRDTHMPVVTLSEQLDDFLWGSLSTKILMDMIFKSEETERESGDVDTGTLSGYTQVSEKEKRQKSGTTIEIDYRNRYFYFRPALGLGSEEIVLLRGSPGGSVSGILSDVDSGFHFPLVYNRDIRFIERNKTADITLGMEGAGCVSPVYMLSMYYLENSFRDYDDTEPHDSRYGRSKNARSFIETRIAIPVNMKKRRYRYIKSVNFSYSRSILLTEFEIPYEGEHCGAFQEDYGLTRAINRLSAAGINIFGYYPGKFLTGRNNYGLSRDYIYGTFNSGISYPNGDDVVDYDNQLRLIENFSLSSTFDFDLFTMNAGAGINQVCERQNIYGIPGQIITRTLNMSFNFNLMKLFNFWFFRPNARGLVHHAAYLDLNYDLNNNMIITSNIEENTHAPGLGLTFKWGRSSLGLSSGIDLRRKQDRQFIPYDDSKRDPGDDIYINNMPEESPFREQDTGYNFSVMYETDVGWIYDLFSDLYRLAARPIFFLEYSMKINRYDYTVTVSPEPYDLHMLTGRLTMDLHKNIQGGLTSRLALERFRNRETDNVSREILSCEVGMNMSLLF